MILDQKLQRMLNDSKIAQLNSERPLHQTAVVWSLVKTVLIYAKFNIKIDDMNSEDISKSINISVA